jgi:hypothetical protein
MKNVTLRTEAENIDHFQPVSVDNPGPELRSYESNIRVNRSLTGQMWIGGHTGILLIRRYIILFQYSVCFINFLNHGSNDFVMIGIPVSSNFI